MSGGEDEPMPPAVGPKVGPAGLQLDEAQVGKRKKKSAKQSGGDSDPERNVGPENRAKNPGNREQASKPVARASKFPSEHLQRNEAAANHLQDDGGKGHAKNSKIENQSSYFRTNGSRKDLGSFDRT